MNTLIERYIYAVGENIPQNLREDVSRELKISIEDMVNSHIENGASEEEVVKKVLCFIFFILVCFWGVDGFGKNMNIFFVVIDNIISKIFEGDAFIFICGYFMMCERFIVHCLRRILKYF